MIEWRIIGPSSKGSSMETRDILYAAGINLAAERGLGPHPLPESYVQAVQAGVDAVLAQATAEREALRERLIEVLADEGNYIYNGTHAVFNEGYGADSILEAEGLQVLLTESEGVL
jgi:hypothetical protein